MTDREETRGVGLPVLLIGWVLGGVLIGAIYQVLITNQRVSRAQTAQLLDQQVLSAGVDLLAQELREVSAVGGDLTMLGEQAVAFRALRAFGLACEVLTDGPATLTVAYQGARFRSGDQVYLFVDGDPETCEDDDWESLEVAEARDGETCAEDGVAAQKLTLSGSAPVALEGRVHPGAVVRSWDEVQYGLGSVGGKPYLIRWQNERRVPLVGPLAISAGFELVYLDAHGEPTWTPTEVATVRITLRKPSTDPERTGSVQDRVATSVFLRN